MEGNGLLFKNKQTNEKETSELLSSTDIRYAVKRKQSKCPACLGNH